MSEEIKTLMLWALGALVALLTGIGQWIFRQIFNKLKELEDRQTNHEKKVQDQFAKIHTELAINASEDKARHEKTMLILTELQKGQDKIFDKLDEYDKNISSFYQSNPELKNPNL